MDKVVHFEIPADDVARAKQFYEEVFGWRALAMEDMGYVMFHTGPTDDKTGMVKEKAFINGGMFKRQGVLTTPVITINVKSIDTAAKEVEKHGGKIVREKKPVGDFGLAAYFTDSEGNLLGLWEDLRKEEKK